MHTNLLTRESVAKRWGISLKTLDYWRWSGGGPQYVKIGRKVFYRPSSIEQFEESRERKNTSSPPSLSSAPVSGTNISKRPFRRKG